MAKEIERRFLVDPQRLPPLKNGNLILQGYFGNTDPAVRIRLQKNQAFLTIKSAVSKLTRLEFEYKITFVDGKKLLSLTKAKVEKERFQVKIDGKIWSVDFFKGENSPLVLAEIELKNEEETFEKPLWAVEEVTEDPKYFSQTLAFTPYQRSQN